jgi:hypothetical protein
MNTFRGGQKLALLGCLLAAFGAAPAYAALGGAPMTTPSGASLNRSDAVANVATSSASGAAATTSSVAYTVRSTTLSNGTVVNEYVTTAGVVFGVAWKGPRIPNLPNLLGSYFPQYVDELKTARAQGGATGPANIVTSGLVVHSGGHMGSFAGQAYLPQALPVGVNSTDIQ